MNATLRPACKKFERDLILYYYGECAAAERLRVEAHFRICPSCSRYTEELHRLLPLTIEADDPPATFWENYSAEVQRKLAGAEPQRPWWHRASSFLRPWPVPALATALALLLALTLTFTYRMSGERGLPPEAGALLEFLPMAENLEFYEAMELLDVMDILEAAGGPGTSST